VCDAAGVDQQLGPVAAHDVSHIGGKGVKFRGSGGQQHMGLTLRGRFVGMTRCNKSRGWQKCVPGSAAAKTALSNQPACCTKLRITHTAYPALDPCGR
jgi:hypothetical protein